MQPTLLVLCDRTAAPAFFTSQEPSPTRTDVGHEEVPPACDVRFSMSVNFMD